MEVLGEFAKYAFLGLTRKDRFFKRSVLKYVSIKKPVLTQSGVKSRVCVNQPDRLWTEPSVTVVMGWSRPNKAGSIAYRKTYARRPSHEDRYHYWH